MNHDRIELEVIRILRKTSLAGSDRAISTQDPLGELGLGLDSLALVEFVTALEKRFQIEMSDQIWTERGQLTVQHFVKAVAEASPTALLAELDPAPSSGQVPSEEVVGLPHDAGDRPHNQRTSRNRGYLANLLLRIRRFCFHRESFLILDFEPSPKPLPLYASPLGLRLREASIADAKALNEFWSAFSYETIDQQEMTMKLFQERLDSGSTCLTAWHEDRIVGMDWHFSKEYSCPFTGLQITWPRDACYGGELYEHQDFQGKGVGLELLAYSLAVTKKNGFRRQVTLVSATNIKMLGASIQLFGLKVIGEIKTMRLFRQPISTWAMGERSGCGGRIML